MGGGGGRERRGKERITAGLAGLIKKQYVKWTIQISILPTQTINVQSNQHVPGLNIYYSNRNNSHGVSTNQSLTFYNTRTHKMDTTELKAFVETIYMLLK